MEEKGRDTGNPAVVSCVADDLQAYFFSGAEGGLKQELDGFLQTAAEELGAGGPVAAPREDIDLRWTELHADFLQVLEHALERRACMLVEKAEPKPAGGAGGVDATCDAKGDAKGDAPCDSAVASAKLMGALALELRERHHASGERGDDAELEGEGLLAAFPRALLAASDFSTFEVLVRETARGHAWDMESMFGC
eukprot:g3351.t1